MAAHYPSESPTLFKCLAESSPWCDVAENTIWGCADRMLDRRNDDGAQKDV